MNKWTKEYILDRITKMGERPEMYAYNMAEFVGNTALLLEFAGISHLDLRGGNGFYSKLLCDKNINFNINIDGNTQTSGKDDKCKRIIDVAKKYFDSDI